MCCLQCNSDQSKPNMAKNIQINCKKSSSIFLKDCCLKPLVLSLWPCRCFRLSQKSQQAWPMVRDSRRWSTKQAEDKRLETTHLIRCYTILIKNISKSWLWPMISILMMDTGMDSVPLRSVRHSLHTLENLVHSKGIFGWQHSRNNCLYLPNFYQPLWRVQSSGDHFLENYGPGGSLLWMRHSQGVSGAFLVWNSVQLSSPSESEIVTSCCLTGGPTLLLIF